MSGPITDQSFQLYDVRFPLLGTVRRTAESPFPPKFVIGDYTRDDNIVESTLVYSTFSGGNGIWLAQMPKDADRYWTNNGITPLYRALSLDALVNDASMWWDVTEPLPENRLKRLDTTLVSLFIPFNDVLYMAIGPTLYSWDETNHYWLVERLWTEDILCSALFNGKLFIGTTTTLHSYDPTTTTWADFATTPSVALITWDGKLFRLDNHNDLWWNADDTLVASWTIGGKLQVPVGWCKQLLIYFDLNQNMVIHAITRIGVYGYSFADTSFYETPLTYPNSLSAGKGAIVWRGELYVPVNEFVYKYNGSTITPVGPSRDDGLPPQLRGDIVTLVGGHAFYYAVISTKEDNVTQHIAMTFFDEVDAATTDPVLFDEFQWIDTFPMSATTAMGGVLVSPGSAWHGLVEMVAGSDMGAACVTSNGFPPAFRLWFSSGSSINYIDRNTGLLNPFQNRTIDFCPYGRLETGWTAIGFENMDKLALTFEVDAQQCSTTETIDLFLAWDYSDQWDHIATITTNGHHKFLIGDTEGRVFRNVRFAVEMRRALNDTEADAYNAANPDLPPVTGVPLAEHQTPLMVSAALGFVRRPPFLWGFQVDVPIVKTAHGRTTKELVEQLYRLSQQTKTAGLFRYRNEETGQFKTHRVLISNIQGAEPAGSAISGRFTLSLVQLDDEDIDNERTTAA